MSGRPKITWGGKRIGAGRPRKTKTTSEKTSYAIRKAARELSKEYGEPIEKAMLRLIYLDGTQDAVKASVFKSYLQSLLVRETQQNIREEIVRGPVIGLPPIREDPALKILGGNKESKGRDSRKINP